MIPRRTSSRNTLVIPRFRGNAASQQIFQRYQLQRHWFAMKEAWLSDKQLALLTIYVIVAVDVFGLTLIVPVIVTYARYLGASEAAVGYLYAAYSVMALIATFFVGKLSDRYGRRAVFFYCCIGAIASFAGSAVSQTFVEFAICRGISGLFSGTLGNAYAYVGDLVPEKDKPRYISYVTATLSTCFVIGPIIGGGFAAIDIRAPFVAAAVMAILELVLIYFYVHDRLPADSTTAEAPLLSEEGKSGESTDGVDGKSAAHGERHRAETIDSTDAVLGPRLGSFSGPTPTEPPPNTAAAPLGHRLQNPTGDTEDQEQPGGEEGKVDDSSRAEAAQGEGESGFVPLDVSPWLNFPAMLIGGLGTFLSSMTYCGMAILVPFLLMDPSFGVVSDHDDDNSNNSNDDDSDDLSHKDSRKIALIIGYLLTLLGAIQVFGMLALFPRVSKRLGLLFTGTVGALIYGGSFCFLVFVQDLDHLYPVVVGLALGYSLCRPVYPAFLALVAHKDRRGDYQSMSTCFIQLAWICSIALTYFWSYSHTGAILYSGAFSLLNSAIMLVYGLATRKSKNSP